MIVGVDYTAAVWQPAGIGRYTRELISATVALGGDYQYRLFYAAGGLPPAGLYLPALQRLCAEHPHVRAVPLPFTPSLLTRLWQRLRLPLPIERFTGQLDVLHAPDFALPPTRARTLVTIHDLSYMRYPQFFVPGLVRYLSHAVPRSLRRADRVLVDSLATGRDLEQLLQIDQRRITVIYPGVASEFRPLPAAVSEPLRRRLELPDTFLLFVSTISPRKNLVRLLEGYAQALEQRHDAVDLVIAGQKGWLYEEVFAAIERLNLTARVRLLNHVDDKDLPPLYNLASACVYPSLYEGFGLPALEALACGTPLVTANNSSLPEVVGDAALKVDAEDVAAIGQAIGRILDDQALRDQLRAAGPEQARAFTWERAARHLLRCYE